MESAVQNFIEFLESIKEKDARYMNVLSLEEKIVASNLIRILKMSSDEIKNGKELFTNFEQLSKFLMMSYIGRREKMEVVFSLFQKDYDVITSSKEASVIVDIDAIQKQNFSSISFDEFLELFHSGNLGQFLDTPDVLLTEKQFRQKEELLDYFLFQDQLRENIKKVKSHYLDQVDSYEEGDIKVIARVFQKMGVDSKLCALICGLLKEDMKKRNQKPLPPKKKIESVSHGVTYPSFQQNKSYKPYRKLNQFLENGKPRRILTTEDLSYVQSLLKEIYGIQAGAKLYQSVLFDNCELFELELTAIRISSLSEKEEDIFQEAQSLIAEDLTKVHPYYVKQIQASLSEIRQILGFLHALPSGDEDYLVYQTMMREEVQKMEESMNMLVIGNNHDRARIKKESNES